MGWICIGRRSPSMPGDGDGRGLAGPVWQPDRQRFRRWLAHEVAARADGGRVELAVEGCTGWRYVVEEITAAGYVAHWPSRPTPGPAGPETSRQDRPHRRRVCCGSCWRDGELPERWIPPSERVGVAGTGPAVQGAARSAHPVGAAHPRRVLPARHSGPLLAATLSAHGSAAVADHRSATVVGYGGARAEDGVGMFSLW